MDYEPIVTGHSPVAHPVAENTAVEGWERPTWRNIYVLHDRTDSQLVKQRWAWLEEPVRSRGGDGFEHGLMVDARADRRGPFLAGANRLTGVSVDGQRRKGRPDGPG